MKRFLFLALALVGCVTSPDNGSRSINLSGRWLSNDGKTIMIFDGNSWSGKFFLRSDGKSDLGISVPFALTGSVDSFYLDSTHTQICKGSTDCSDTIITEHRVSLTIRATNQILDDGSLKNRNPDEILYGTHFKRVGADSANRYGFIGTIQDSLIDFYYGMRIYLQK